MHEPAQIFWRLNRLIYQGNQVFFVGICTQMNCRKGFAATIVDKAFPTDSLQKPEKSTGLLKLRIRMNLWQDFLINDQKVIHKWVHYFPIYERHFSSWRNKSITFVEIGVSRGGSLQMWQRFFGPMSKIVGIDINPKCKDHEAPGIFVRIGDQSDPAFLQSIIDEFGNPDIVLDDGSHRMDHISSSFQFFYPKMHKNAIYMVEDLHTAYWKSHGGGIDQPESFINFAKDCVDKLNAVHTRGAIQPDMITRETFGISFYDSIVCFEKGDVWRKEAPKTGGKSNA